MQARKVAVLGVLDLIQRALLVHTCITKRSSDFAALLALLDGRYGPQPGPDRKAVMLVLGNAPIHTSLAAPAARPWPTAAWLPRYAPKLNAIENTWRDLKRHYLAHRTFRDVAELNQAIQQAVATLNTERAATHPCHNLVMAA